MPPAHNAGRTDGPVIGADAAPGSASQRRDTSSSQLQGAPAWPGPSSLRFLGDWWVTAVDGLGVAAWSIAGGSGGDSAKTRPRLALDAGD
mmetsp:Transcript_24774/g.93719  ORF Transcript_24774/g.93719 Transcript_24774/m.93719 type:complete len:90 (+) Transcript_24774:341-610(+)